MLLGLTVGFGIFAGPHMGQEEVATIAVIGLLSGGVFTLWAVVLAIRALWAGERQTLPILLLILVVAIPMGGFGVASWNDDYESIGETTSDFKYWTFTYFLPVIFPFISFVALTGAPLFLWLQRRRKRSRMRAGGVEFSRRERWRFALKCMSVYTMLSAVILIPMPLFVMCAVWHGGIRTEVAERTPDFIRDASEALLYRLYENETLDLDTYEDYILSRGLVSPLRLNDRIFDLKPRVSALATRGIFEHFPKRAADFGELKIGKNSILDYYLGKYGSTAQRLAAIRTAQSGKYVSDQFFKGLSEGKPDAEVNIELEKYLAGNVPSRSAALAAIVQWSPESQRFKLIHDFMFNSDVKEVSEFLTRTREFFLVSQYESFALWDALEHPDYTVRFLAVSRLDINFNLKPITLGIFLRKLVTLSKSNNRNLAVLAPTLVSLLPLKTRDKNDKLIVESHWKPSLFPQGIPQATLDRVLERAEAELKRMDDDAGK